MAVGTGEPCGEMSVYPSCRARHWSPFMAETPQLGAYMWDQLWRVARGTAADGHGINSNWSGFYSAT